ncbi:hypothetical protein [Salimicrobium flavidum]|uniref:Lipoprotein n=1 Tax=Salimicrobium flavidum TaxID=570947 RepID=A0A1N7IWS2_9BACI|nr:hypothetical protein [Salimicrobium flavidum]SIS41457.1 hypothetical protein SAMN05421687_102365 [Salimicrobium flavidum]
MKKIMTVLLFAFLSFLVACGGSEENSESSEEERQAHENENSEITGQVLEEDGVINGSVYTEDGSAKGTMIVEKSVKDEKAKELAEKYASQLQEEYPDSSVNVQVVRDGDNVANISK